MGVPFVPMNLSHALRRAALAVSGAVLLSPFAPAVAHPFGDPQQVEISATATGLQLRWSATVDDLGVLASWIGATDGSGSIVVYEDGEFAPEESSELPGTQLARAPQLADYLLERITVTADDSPCSGELLQVDDVEADGATLDFDCGGPVATADITIETLTDVDENYRTLASGPYGQRHAYASDTGVRSWTLTHSGSTPTTIGESAPSGRSAARQLGAIGLVGIALAGIGIVFRRTRRASGPTDSVSRPQHGETH